MARRRVTIREVAQAAGVSTQTVSRVLNYRPDVAPDTVARVREVIAELSYSPNLLARGLTQGRTHLLGVVAYGLEYFGPSRIITGIEQQAAAMGYTISLTLIHRPETDDVDALLANLVGRQVDGVLWAIPEVANNRAWLRSGSHDLPVPLVLVGGPAAEQERPSIGIDNEAMGRLATGHLLAGGARTRRASSLAPSTGGRRAQREAGWRRRSRGGRTSAGRRAWSWKATGRPPAARRVSTVSCARSPGSMRSSRATTRWRWASCMRRTGWGCACRRTSPSSASTTSPRARTSGRPSRRSISPCATLACSPWRPSCASSARAHRARHADDSSVAPVTLLQPELIVRQSSRPVKTVTIPQTG